MIMACSLMDIGYSGNRFTWHRGHLWQRLDRVLFNNSWVNTFNLTKVEHLSRTLSDHSSLLINIKNNPTSFPTQFRFQNMWLLHDSFLDVVQVNWNAPVYPDNSISGMNRLWLKLKRLKLVLNWWNHKVFKNLFSNILIAETKINNIEDLCQYNRSEANMGILKEAKGELSKLQIQEETFWKQKAAAKHLVEGNNNTKYFHSLVNKKCSINYIHKIARANGSFTKDKDEISSMAVNFFHSHLNKAFIPYTNVDPSIIPNVITFEDNANLSKVPLMEEIKGILFNMKVDSAAGPDGYTTKFFQTTWSIIANDVFHAVKDFFNGSPIPKFFTSTTIILIPKNPAVNLWNDFRPISLCTMFYKLISKLMMSRLYVLLPKIISPFQMGFVKGRAIAENILLAQKFCQDLDI
ncbi:hypothetical protein KFK09_014502 [Dendrobium nobile]|uniref:Reverse transcriptase domain-containing protein n=1 Tax=Dendrobium nobile TaxID=94219 RepID=A0A8T3B392_DENNO|nr:hypothetical protein KFK09_014502 [Dendrobium nobile]